jgi:hypothetical protein
LRQGRNLTEAEKTAGNLSITLTGMSREAKKAIKRISILAEQLKEASLSLIMAGGKKVIMALKSECTICHLITSRTRNNTTQTMEITY